MPRFLFESPIGTPKYSCRLVCSRCGGSKADGSPCTRTVCIGTEFCWQHLPVNAKLKIAKSGIPGAGRSLFAWLVPEARGRRGTSVVFARGAKIAAYRGERVTARELSKRYGRATAPYGAGDGALFIDSACRRSAGAMANGSDGRRKANAVLAADGGRGTIELRAKRDIRHF
jgi:hypothetical protein